MNDGKIRDYHSKKLTELVVRLYENSPFYRERFQNIGLVPGDIKGIEDLSKLPFTDKMDLRDAYPLKMMAVPETEVVRIHSSSGTTGKPIIIPYTQNDVDTWAELMARTLRMTGVNKNDRVQITPGYGLWTAGIGFQAGVERIGAMAIPIGPGNTDKQLEMMVDMQTTVLIGTSSYGLLLAEEATKRGLADKIKLKHGVFGSERWGDKMRQRIEDIFGIETYDIYGLTEIYGPGIAIDCPYHNGLHYWHDHLIFEIIDHETGAVLPAGTFGELVITTITKEGMPLLRYRTHDLTRIIPEQCPCGSEYPLIDRVLGRTDDMFKIKGVNIYPGQIDHVLKITDGASSEYQIVLERHDGRDSLLIRLEAYSSIDAQTIATQCVRNIKTKIGVLADVEVLPIGSLPRSEKKSKRVIDNRQ